MYISCFGRSLCTFGIMRRNLAVVLSLVFFATIICNPAMVKAEDSTMTVTGHILDEMGKPAYGIDVTLELGSGDNVERKQTQTDTNGYYNFLPMYITSDNLLEQFHIIVENPGVPGLKTTRVEYYNYGTHIYDFGIIKYGTTIVHVRDESEAPVPAGVPMWFSYVSPSSGGNDWPWSAPAGGETPHYITDGRGDITLQLDATWGYDGTIDKDANCYGGFNYGYAAGKKGYGGIDQTFNMVDRDGVDHTSNLRYELPNNPDLNGEVIDVSTQAGKTREVNFYVRPLGKVSAIAKDAVTAEPVQGVRWNYPSSLSGFTKYGGNEGDGSEFSIYGNGGDTIYFEAKDPSDPPNDHFGHQTAVGEAVVTPWGNEIITLNMQPNSPGKINGRVVDSSRNGISGAAVELLWPPYRANITQAANNGYQSLKSITTDNNGYYSFTDVVPTNQEGKYIARATKTGIGQAVSEEITLGSGGEVIMEDLVIAHDSQPPYWRPDDRLSAESIGWTGVELRWRKASDDTSVKGYRIYNGNTMLADSGYREYYNSVGYTVKDLEPSTVYNLYVKAYDDAGNLSTPLSVNITTLEAYDFDSKVIRASVNAQGIEANSGNIRPSISADGRFVVFESDADNLCDNDTNNSSDIFLFDRNTGETRCISLTANGVTGNASSQSAAISADGRYIVFASEASDLIENDNNNNTDVYLYDRTTNSIELISTGLNGAMANNYCGSPSISGDGHYIAFASAATNLVENDNNGKEDIFVKDRKNGAITMISYQPNGNQIAGTATNPVISANGLYAAYEVYVNYINSIYVYDITNKATELVTKRYDDASTPYVGYNSSISADGRYIAFYSAYNGLVENDNNGTDDIFVYDRVNDTMQLVSVSSSEAQGNKYSMYPAISADGNLVAFKSLASNLVDGDTVGCIDVFVRDLVKGTTERISVSESGAEGDSDSSFEEWAPAISAGGQYIAYDSAASNLVGSDNNGEVDIFVYDRGYVEGPDIYAPVLSNPRAGNITKTTANLSFTASEAGTYYYLVCKAADTAPDAEAIKAQGDAIAKGSGSASIGLNTVNATGLTASNAYKAYIIVEDGNENTSEVLTISFSTAAEASTPTIASITPVANVQVAYGTSAQNAIAALPAATTIKDSEGNTHTVNLNWTISGYNGNAAGNYTATGTFSLPEGVNQTTPATALQVTSTLTVSVPSPPSGGYAPSVPVESAILTAGAARQNINVNIDRANGSASASLDENLLNSVFAGAQMGNDGLKKATIEMPETQGLSSFTLELPVKVLSSETMDRRIEMESKTGTITLPNNMLLGMGLENNGNVSIGINNVDKARLPQNVRDRVGVKPVIELKLMSANRAIEWNNPNAPVLVSIPYTPTAEELANPDHITIWYVDGSGNVIEVPSGRYDPVTGTVSFSTTHFSNYAVVYVIKSYDDLASVQWAKKQIEILASKGIVRGVSDNEFAPQQQITRADFLYFLIRTLGINAKIDGNFDDIKADAYYYKEISIAKKLGITLGTGNNKFSPDKSITRQDMMVLTAKALRVLKKVEQKGTISDLNRFADKSLIAPYALDGVASVVKEGLIIGSGDNVNPLGNTTRAEAAVLLYRLYNK